MMCAEDVACLCFSSMPALSLTILHNLRDMVSIITEQELLLPDRAPALLVHVHSIPIKRHSLQMQVSLPVITVIESDLQPSRRARHTIGGTKGAGPVPLVAL